MLAQISCANKNHDCSTTNASYSFSHQNQKRPLELQFHLHSTGTESNRLTSSVLPR